MDYSNRIALPEGFQIRDFAEGDYPAVEEFWETNGLGGSHRGDSHQILQDTIQAGGHLLLVTDKDGRIAGTSWLTNDSRRTYLHHFGIAGLHRRKGLARALLTISLLVAKTDGFQVKIEVHRDNIAALNLYKKAGFGYLGDYDVYIIRDISSIEA